MRARRETPPGTVSRIACLLVPALPLAAELRAHPELLGHPLAIAAGPGARAEIVAVSPEAARAGVRTLTHVVHGRASCAGLVVRVLSPARDRAARDALLDAALSSAPRAEHAPPGSGAYVAEAAVFVDARGVTALFHSEAGFAGALAERARRLGLEAVVAVASSRGVAQIAARGLAQGGDAAGGVQIIAPGAEADFLAPLSLDLLNPDDAQAEALSRFGLRRIADLLQLPERALVTRLGPGIRPLLARARGHDPAPPPPVPPDARLEEATDLEAPLERLEPLGFVLRGLLDRLGGRLDSRGLAFGDLELGLRLEGGGHDLNLQNLGRFLEIEGVLEVSIGHAIVVESFDYGFEETLRRYLEIVDE
jgi:protein ImuB